MQVEDEGHKAAIRDCQQIKDSIECRQRVRWTETESTLVHPCNLFYSSRLANALGKFVEFAVLSGSQLRTVIPRLGVVNIDLRAFWRLRYVCVVARGT